MPNAAVLTTLVFISACVAWDIRERRIPNALCLAGLVAGVATSVALQGPSGLVHSGAGFLSALFLLLPAFALGGIGGGDVKMMAAIGAMVGARVAAMGLLCGVIAGGLIMLVHLWRIGRVREKLQATRTMFTAAILGGSLDPLKAPANDPTAVALPYSVPLGLGVLLTLGLHGLMGV